MIFKSYAKINLYLDVLGKRDDGYHDILSVLQSISLHDLMTIDEKEGKDVSFFSNDPSLKWGEGNLIFRAYETFFDTLNLPRIGLRITLKKRIPKGCGFGGGSSNAGVILLYLGRRFGVDLKDLERMALDLGSDVKYFLHGGTAIVKGKGDEVELVEDITGYSVNLKIPNLSFRTKDMYQKISCFINKNHREDRDPLHLLQALRRVDPDGIRSNVFNIFENLILLENPQLSALLENPHGIVSSFTGKGPAVFTLLYGESGRYRFVSKIEYSSQSM